LDTVLNASITPPTPGKKFLITYAIGCLLLTLLVTILCAEGHRTYLQSNVRFYDPLGYNEHLRTLQADVRTDGRWKSVVDEWQHGLMPGFSIPLVLLAPQLLHLQAAHLFPAALMLFTALFVVGIAVAARWKSSTLAWAAGLWLVAIPGLYHPGYGLGAFWLDFPAGLLTAAALASLLLRQSQSDWRWLLLFVLLAFWMTLARPVSALYLFLLAAPWFAWRTFDALRQKRFGVLTIDLAIPALGLGGTVLPYLLQRHRALADYYTVWGYGTRSITESLLFSYQSLLYFIGWPFLLLAIAWFLCQRIGPWRGPWKAECAAWLHAAWWINAVPLFLGLSQQIGDARHTLAFVAPLVVLAVFANPPHDLASFMRREIAVDLPRWVAVRLALPLLPIITALVLVITSVSVGMQVGRPDAWRSTERLWFYLRLGEALEAIGGEPRIAIFYEHTTAEQLRLATELRHRRKWEPVFATGLDTFHTIGGWEQHYPGQSPEAVAQDFVRRIENADLILTFSDPATLERPLPTEFSYFPMPHTRAVSAAVLEHVITSGEWEEVFRVPSIHYESVSGWRRRQPTLPAE